MEGRRTLDERPSCFALPDMLGSGFKIDCAYVDSWHTFEAVLLDFFYLDKLMTVRGVMGFDNCTFNQSTR
jgi:hypothetical protein